MLFYDRSCNYSSGTYRKSRVERLSTDEAQLSTTKSGGMCKIPLVPQKIVSTLLLLPGGFSARNENTAVGEALLFADLIVVPSRGIEPQENVFPAGICFVGA
jgi:hypothetical protein